MSASGDARQKAMDVNRSIRSIKTELEKLLEMGAITDDHFSSIHDTLPAEWSLRGGPPAGAPTQNHSAGRATASRAPPAPPATTAAADADPVVGYASAKYKYDAPNDGDLAFDKGDTVAVYNVINEDWWRGRNLRSGGMGIFPRQYIAPDDALATLERTNQLLPGVAQQASTHPNTDTDCGAAPPAYHDQFGGAGPAYETDPKSGQAVYAGEQPQYGQTHPQQQQHAPSHQPSSYGQQQVYYSSGLSHEQPQAPHQQQSPPQVEQKDGTGKKIGGKLGNAFVTGVGFAAGAELVGAIL